MVVLDSAEIILGAKEPQFADASHNAYDVLAGVRISSSYGAVPQPTAHNVGQRDETHTQTHKVRDGKGDVICKLKQRWMVLAIGPALHLFDVSCVGQVEWKGVKRFTDDVVGVEFLPDIDDFIVVLSSGHVHSCAPSFSRWQEHITLPTKPQRCTISLVDVVDKYVVCVLDGSNGSAYLLEAARNDNLQPPTHASKLPPSYTATTLSGLMLAATFPVGLHAKFIVSTLTAFVLFPCRRGEMVKMIPLVSFDDDAPYEQPVDLMPLMDDVQAVHAVGCSIVLLTTNNELLFFDMNVMPGDGERRRAVEFAFLDVDEFNEWESSTNIKLILKTEHAEGYEYTIYNLNSAETTLAVECSQHAQVLGFSTPTEETAIPYVDPFPPTDPESVVVKFVSEAQPQMRLKLLLDSHRFEDALEFAKRHKLPPNAIYLALVRGCQDEIQNSLDSSNGYEDSSFEAMMGHLEMLVEDCDEIGDLVLTALMLMRRYEHLERVLKFAERRHITDGVMAKEIGAFRYELSTYRMVFGIGDGGASFDSSSQWPTFVANRDHIGYFDDFCREGLITEARILWHRYPNEVAVSLVAGVSSVERLLNMLKASITARPTISGEVAQFVESDLIATLLFSPACSSMFEEFGKMLFAFVAEIVLLLEAIELEKFPSNSLHFATIPRRGLRSILANAITPDQHVNALYVLKMLEFDSMDEEVAAGRLNRMALNLEKLERIHRVYQCPMSYTEYSESSVETVCYRILDQIRTAQSVKEHVSKFVFPYMAEHKLEQNEMLYSFVRRLSDTFYRGRMKYSDNTWDRLCLQLIECITDQDIRCRSIVEVCAGAIPPWPVQLTNVVNSTLRNETGKIDPRLLEKLRLECTAAELGQILVSYQIPTEARSRILGASSLRGLLKFILKSPERTMDEKLADVLKIVAIYEKLKGIRLLDAADCHYLYGVVLIQDMGHEDETRPLIDLFNSNSIKEEGMRAVVARRLVSHLKGLLGPTTNEVIGNRRLAWISALLCVAERHLAHDGEAAIVVEQARSIRLLQTRYATVVGFDLLSTERSHQERTRLLKEFISEWIHTRNRKPLTEMISYGRLLLLDTKTICQTAILAQIESGFIEDALSSLGLLVTDACDPSDDHLDIGLRTCTSVLWEITNAAHKSGSELEPLLRIVDLFKNVLPTLVDWSTQLRSPHHTSGFCRISRYISLLAAILDQFPAPTGVTESSDGAADRSPLLLTYHRRLEAFTPREEGAFFSCHDAVHCAELVAASVVEPPVEGAKEIAQFHAEMCDAWQRLFSSLSSSLLIEVTSRNMAKSLPCFTSTGVNVGGPLDQCGLELCKKILTPPTADICLAAHLLLGMDEGEMKKALHELRRWAMGRKSVRSTLNLVRVSLHSLLLTKDYGLQRQITVWFEATLWQKRMLKLGVSIATGQMAKDRAVELIPEWTRAMVTPAVIRRYCNDLQVVNASAVLFAYALELCRQSSVVLATPPSNNSSATSFAEIVELARASLAEVVPDEEMGASLSRFATDEICPYNYEALSLLLRQLNQWILLGVSTDSQPFLKEALMLIDFLRASPRENGFTQLEVRWYRKRVTSRSIDKDASTFVSTFDESNFNNPGGCDTSGASVPTTVTALNPNLYRKQEVLDTNFPSVASRRLPYHLFLIVDEDQFKSVVLPALLNEVTVYNYKRWSYLLSNVRLFLNYSRTMLLVSTICAVVNDAVTYRRVLDDDELRQIHKLISESSNRLGLLKGLANRFKKLPLCALKVSMFKISRDVMADLIGAGVGGSPRESEECRLFHAALESSLAKYRTDLLLERSGLLNTDTAAMSGVDPKQLIAHVCSNEEIDWNCHDSVADRMRVAEQIASIHSVQLEEVFDALVEMWLPGTELADAVHSDPDATIDFTSTGVPGTAAGSDSELIVPVLYNDPKIRRIVYLLRKHTSDELVAEKARRLVNKFEQDVSVVSGGYMTKLRIAYCLIGWLDDAQMHDVFKSGLNHFCGMLVTLLNQRLLSICRIDLPIKDFNERDKRELVQSMLSPRTHYRQTPEISFLIAAVIIDNQIGEIDLLEKAAARIAHLHMAKPLLALLRYVRNIPDIVDFPSIAGYYAKAFEWNFEGGGGSNSGGSDERDDQRRAMIHFVIGCPVEGGSAAFGRSCSLLSSSGLNQAAEAIALAADSTSASHSRNRTAPRASDIRFHSTTSVDKLPELHEQ